MTFLVSNALTKARLPLASWREVERTIKTISRKLTQLKIAHTASATYGCIVGHDGTAIVDTLALPGNDTHEDRV